MAGIVLDEPARRSSGMSRLAAFAGGIHDCATTHKTIREATQDVEDFRFNTMISRLMEQTTALQKARDAGPVDRGAWDEAIDVALLLTAPLAPHIAEELWERRGKPYSIHLQPWPTFNPELAHEEEVELVVQVNGKVRDRLMLVAGADEASARAAASRAAARRNGSMARSRSGCVCSGKL
jgi:leucyl-tRNA synthetase